MKSDSSTSPDTGIERQLDELLAQVEQRKSTSKPTPPPVPPPPLAAVDDHADDLDGEFQPPPPAADLAGDTLANQIQELLDEARQREKISSAATRPEPPAQPAEPRGAPARVQASVADEPLTEIDAYLAEHADDAVAGDFETVSEVLAAAQPPPPAEPAPPTEAPAPDGFNASAQDVARELQEQPENQPRARTAPPPVAPDLDAQTDDDAEAAAPARRWPKLSLPTHALRHCCAWLNRPLATASPQTRTNLGYIALITLFNGSALLLGLIIKSLG